MTQQDPAPKALFSFKQKEVQRAFKRADFRAKTLGLKLLQSPFNEGSTHGKLLIIIPQKSAKSCKRNRFRRQVKAIFYQEKLYKKLIISILFIYKQAMDMSFEQIKEFLVENI